MDYAVFKTGGKQYRVQPGDTLDVELLPYDVDSLAEFDEVLAVSQDGSLTVGTPNVTGARVRAPDHVALQGPEGHGLQVQGQDPVPSQEGTPAVVHQGCHPGYSHQLVAAPFGAG